MPTSTQVRSTDFSRDVLGRYVGNGFDEGMASTRDVDNLFHYIVLPTERLVVR
jgi:hypothetical protein